MGGATVPVPGGGVGQLAFPSAAEPNPILKGLRGTGPEQVINQIPTPTSSPAAAPPSQAPSGPGPFAGAELFQLPNPTGNQYGPLLYSLQGGGGQLLPSSVGGAPGTNLMQNTSTPQELAAYGYSDISQVPILPGYGATGLQATGGLNPYSGINYSYGNGQPGTLFGPMTNFNYNQGANAFTSYTPNFNPYGGAVFNTQAQNPFTTGPQSYTLFNYPFSPSNLQPYGTKSTTGT